MASWLWKRPQSATSNPSGDGTKLDSSKIENFGDTSPTSDISSSSSSSPQGSNFFPTLSSSKADTDGSSSSSAGASAVRMISPSEVGIYGPLYVRRLQIYQAERNHFRQVELQQARFLEAKGNVGRFVQDIGVAFLIGCITGTPFYAAAAAFRAPPSTRRRAAWEGVRQNSPRLGGIFAFFNLVYSGSQAAILHIRGATVADRVTDISSAFCAGAMLSARKGVVPALTSGVWVAMFVYFLHLSPQVIPAATATANANPNANTTTPGASVSPTGLVRSNV